MLRWFVVAALVCSSGELVLSQEVDSVSRLTVLLFGDINLGRALGQDLLRGKIDYPFENMKAILKDADIVFANLESQVTDQHGETESPKSNYVFCAPPAAAKALKRGGVTIVSTANNHAFDYSLRGLQETIKYLEEEKIRYVGTSKDSVRAFPPVVIKRRGISVGFLAYTQFVNGNDLWWGRISIFNSVRARRDIASLRSKVDCVIVSFHGGGEYADRPDEKTLRQMRSLVDAGADVVVGHHPHVPQGIEEYRKKLIFYSLGNFVFNQSTEWAKRAFGIELRLSRLNRTIGVESIRLLPIRAYKQPAPDLSDLQVQGLVDRLRTLSTITIDVQKDSIFVKTL